MKSILLSLVLCSVLFACHNNSTKEDTHTTDYSVRDQAGNTEWLAIPNKSVGKITPDMTEANIIEVYGKEQVIHDSLHVGEGFFIQSTVVFPNTPNELRIAWEEEKTFEKIARIIVKKENAQWHTPNGLKIGTPLQKVIDLNGVPFNFWGFDWDYSGSVSSWEGGNFDGQGIGVRLSYGVDIQNLDRHAIEAVVGDQEVSSAEPILKDMQVRVSEMFFYFP
ncbi:MAG: hypothetical protein R3E32_18565 [Chitinophagales bacterium]